MSAGTCNQVTSVDCQAPAGLDREPGDGIRLTTCYVCGLAVCRSCSSVQSVRVVSNASGRCRLVPRDRRTCDGCLEQEPDGQARLMLLNHHRAGYPETTLDWCRSVLAAQAAQQARYAPAGRR